MREEIRGKEEEEDRPIKMSLSRKEGPGKGEGEGDPREAGMLRKGDVGITGDG